MRFYRVGRGIRAVGFCGFFALRQAMRGVYRVRSFGDRVSVVVACRDIESEVAVMQVPRGVSVGKLAGDRGKASITSDTLGWRGGLYGRFAWDFGLVGMGWIGSDQARRLHISATVGAFRRYIGWLSFWYNLIIYFFDFFFLLFVDKAYSVCYTRVNYAGVGPEGEGYEAWSYN